LAIKIFLHPETPGALLFTPANRRRFHSPQDAFGKKRYPYTEKYKRKITVGERNARATKRQTISS
jgi:hypothetical protein